MSLDVARTATSAGFRERLLRLLVDRCEWGAGPTVKWMAQELGRTRISVERALAVLEEDRLVEKRWANWRPTERGAARARTGT